MNLDTYLSEKKQLIEDFLIAFFDRKIKEADKDNCYYVDTLEKLKPFVLNGKFLRGILLLLSVEMCGGTITTEAIQAAAALELNHSALLIHDDIMDNDYTRRGKRTIFAQYVDYANKFHLKTPVFFGQSIGMMAGDLCLLLAFELLGDCTTDIKVSQAVHKVYSVEIQLCISGQILDYSFGTHINNPTSQDIMKVYTHKTARYTFVVPFTLGALLSKADEKTISQLDMLGEKLGIIYQIKDDELGIYGDEKTIGKPIGSDIRENKKTIFRMLLYSKVTKEEKQYLDNCFGNSEITSQDVEKIKQLLEKYDVINTLHQQIETMYTEIKNQVPQLNFKPQCQQLLVDFIDYTLKRNK